MTSVVYFIRGGDRIKIGTTMNLKSRLKEIQSMSPVVLTVVGAVTGDRVLEQKLHRVLAEHRTHGEWFVACFDVYATLNTLLVREQRRSQSPSSVPIRMSEEDAERAAQDDHWDMVRMHIQRPVWEDHPHPDIDWDYDSDHDLYDSDVYQEDYLLRRKLVHRHGFAGAIKVLNHELLPEPLSPLTVAERYEEYWHPDRCRYRNPLETLQL